MWTANWPRTERMMYGLKMLGWGRSLDNFWRGCSTWKWVNRSKQARWSCIPCHERYTRSTQPWAFPKWSLANHRIWYHQDTIRTNYKRKSSNSRQGSCTFEWWQQVCSVLDEWCCWLWVRVWVLATSSSFVNSNLTSHNITQLGGEWSSDRCITKFDSWGLFHIHIFHKLASHRLELIPS